MPRMADASCIAATEAAAARAWPPAETEPLGGWLLRCGRAGSRRLNSVQTIAFTGEVALDEAIAAVERWYRNRGLPSCFQLNDAVRPRELDAELERRGYGVRTPTSVMTATDWAASEAGAGIDLAPRADERVLSAISDSSWSAELVRQRREVFGRITPPHCFAVATVDGAPVAGGLCVADGDLAGLFSMRTQPVQRGRGLARSVAGALMTWARAQGARRLYLQVEDDNGPALNLYGQLGFTRVYGYHYREARS
jgi:GNAT superfamily N-acetyltransferase